MNVTRKWKRVLAYGCSHGEKMSVGARTAILRMVERWKPHANMHLGDWWDTTAWRSGARGTSDEAQEHGPDIDAGLEFLRDARANVMCIGNHEDRIYRARRHYNAIIKALAKRTVETLEARAALNKAVIVPWHQAEWYELGGYRWGHGHLWNENYIRDSAEAYGNCVVAHGHRAGVYNGRRLDSAKCYAVGCLCAPFDMDYAKSRRSTLAWSGGFVWGEYTDTEAVLWLHEQPRETSEWRLPV